MRTHLSIALVLLLAAAGAIGQQATWDGYEAPPIYEANVVTTAAAVNNAHCVWNGVGSGQVVRLLVARIYNGTAVAGSCTVQRITGYTGGTPLSFAKRDTRDPDPNAAIVFVNQPATTSGGVTLVTVRVQGFLGLRAPLWTDDGGDTPKEAAVALEGEGICVTRNTTIGNVYSIQAVYEIH